MPDAPLTPCDAIIDDFVKLAKLRDKNEVASLFAHHDGLKFAPTAFVLSHTQVNVDVRYARTLLELECAREAREIARRYEIVRHGVALAAMGRHPSEIFDRTSELMTSEEIEALETKKTSEEAIGGRTCSLYSLEEKKLLALKGATLHFQHSMLLPIDCLVRIMHHAALLRLRGTEGFGSHFVSDSNAACPLGFGIQAIARDETLDAIDSSLAVAVNSLRHGWRLREDLASEGLKLLLDGASPKQIEESLDAMLPLI